MKSLTLTTLTALTTTLVPTLAQNAGLNLPSGPELKAGSDVIVQVTRPNSLTGSTELAVAIGLQSCPNSECIEADETLGTVLYHGAFNPVYHEYYLPPYENFTVSVPEGVSKGKAVVGVAHVALVGASNWPFLEVLNKTVTIV
ncbi:uncharacterized protein DSM5745_06170 [Aspergillus mulundensis]|uniref:Uncharacterized protein n=1 Tax=Aspergillus mulundensis TaxID=1810919 RepID=A0A3D8Q4T1_9EURO|nr:Uncharacterized protein DSM5745_11603 [Aspergillus mulundensis]XP_026597821.1 Uncharacterized protein DSM5745_11601 [Aspergillus mulundensis]XP_026604018.1 Uncharacterized protein DSM5745_06170 [Aspergillus mulundensis]RDW56680.1 Uncharacterized protein DSM5745_11603 [Aspergillus mulundensis]RDW56697.1 Uncharacterized protein DSM5745_11601 [Aspergillus mulundensis]RDW79318.1 Uncharacterized protein DSM5745_06170 [Aspergillus mulundensis]